MDLLSTELTSLLMVTKRRADETLADRELLVAAYLDRLAPLSGESVIWALRKWPENSSDGKWFPAWADLHEMIEARVRERRLMMGALR